MADDSPYSWANIKGKFRSRASARARNNLGIIQLDVEDESKLYRDKNLEFLDSYYENRQYDHLPPWDDNQDKNGDHISIRKRKPRLSVAFAKTLSERLASKLVGQSVFPKFLIADSPDDQEFLKAIIRESKLKFHIIEPVRRMLNTGSSFLRFYLAAGTFKLEWYSSKYCYPEFQENGELESLAIKYVYTDTSEKDQNGNFKRRWYKLELTTLSEILYDNPEYKEDSDDEPVFTEVERVDHNLGFVQGEWFRAAAKSGEKDSPDGYGITADLIDFIDELCYSLSQSSQAVAYNQDPQLSITGIDVEEVNNLIRSVTKAWNLGRQGKAEFLESNLDGVSRAMELRDKVRLNIQDISRIVLLDPEKIVGSANSGKAMEILHGPLKDLVDELREPVEQILKNLVLKMALACLMANKQGIEIPIAIPPEYVPQSLDVELKWPPIFQQTIEDLQKKVQVASQAKTTGLVSPATALKFIAEDFGVEDQEAELVAINEAAAAAAALNPFGGF